MSKKTKYTCCTGEAMPIGRRRGGCISSLGRPFHKWVIRGIVLGICGGLFVSCADSNRALTRAERKLIDSFYNQQLVRLQGELDTLCMRQHDSIFAAKFDSILQKRESERREIMGKYKSEITDQ